MAVVSVRESYSGREGEFGENLERRYTRVFEVETDSKSDGPIAVGFATGIPRYFEPYKSYLTGEVDSLALCRRIRPVQDPDYPFRWTVTCEYATKGLGAPDDPGKPGSGASDNPELQPPDVDFDWEEQQVAPRLDRAGKPFLNSAKCAFDPPVMLPVPRLVLVIERNELNVDLLSLLGYANAINTDPFLFFPAGCAQLKPPKPKLVYKGPIRYWRVRYEVRLREPADPYPFQPEILDAGLCKLATDGPEVGKPTPILDPKYKQPITQAVPLASGQPMDPAILENLGPVYIPFKWFPEKPFAPLNLIY